MILDSSAIVAILLREPEHEVLQSKLAAAPSLGVSTPTLLEASIVLSARLERNAQGILARFIQETEHRRNPIQSGPLLRGPSGLAELRQRTPSGGTQLWGLRRLRHRPTRW